MSMSWDEELGPPPPYTPRDPLTPASTIPPSSPITGHRADSESFGGSFQSNSDHLLPPFQPHHRRPSAASNARSDSTAATSVCQFSSAGAYFETRDEESAGQAFPPPGEPQATHVITIDPLTTSQHVSLVPACWRSTRAITINLLQVRDMQTFANYLLPPHLISTDLPRKLREEMLRNGAGKPEAEETEEERRSRVEAVVAEWNEGFFRPRGLQVVAAFDDSLDAEPLPVCPQCSGLLISAGNSNHSAHAAYMRTAPAPASVRTTEPTQSPPGQQPQGRQSVLDVPYAGPPSSFAGWVERIAGNISRQAEQHGRMIERQAERHGKWVETTAERHGRHIEELGERFERWMTGGHGHGHSHSHGHRDLSSEPVRSGFHRQDEKCRGPGRRGSGSRCGRRGRGRYRYRADDEDEQRAIHTERSFDPARPGFPFWNRGGGDESAGPFYRGAQGPFSRRHRGCGRRRHRGQYSDAIHDDSDLEVDRGGENDRHRYHSQRRGRQHPAASSTSASSSSSSDSDSDSDFKPESKSRPKSKAEVEVGVEPDTDNRGRKHDHKGKGRREHHRRHRRHCHRDEQQVQQRQLQQQPQQHHQQNNAHGIRGISID